MLLLLPTRSVKLCAYKGFKGNLMGFASLGIRTFQRILITLLFAIVTACAFFWPGSTFHGITLFRRAITVAQATKPVLRVQVNLQPVEVQVKDARGNDVPGLSAKDFTVLEDGKRQEIAFFDAGNGPVSLAVLVDSSSSMDSQGRLGSAQAIAAEFMRTARPGDETFAMDFTDQMGPFQRLTREQLINPSASDIAPAPSHGSALFDAIATALCHLRAAKNPRQAVIVISDGDDQQSRISLEQLIGLVRSSHAQLFMIGLKSRPYFNLAGHAEPKLTLISGRDIDNPAVVFDRLMKESGAEFFIPKSHSNLADALKAVSNLLQSEYTLAYYPQKNSNKNLRKIEVKVPRRGARVLARRFVGSEQNAMDSVHFDETCKVASQFYPYPFESKLTHGPAGRTYREDFSDPRSGWPRHEDSNYISSGYELSNPMQQARQVSQMMPLGSGTEVTTTTFQESVIAAYGPWWSDFRASVTIDAAPNAVAREASPKSLHDTRLTAGLIFRMNVDGYYALLINGATQRRELSVELVRRDFPDVPHTESVIIPWTKVAGREAASGTELSVEAIGKQISIFVDGQKLNSAQDDAFDQGLMGFVISGPGRATFRNLVVEQR